MDDKKRTIAIVVSYFILSVLVVSLIAGLVMQGINKETCPPCTSTCNTNGSTTTNGTTTTNTGGSSTTTTNGGTTVTTTTNTSHQLKGQSKVFLITAPFPVKYSVDNGVTCTDYPETATGIGATTPCSLSGMVGRCNVVKPGTIGDLSKLTENTIASIVMRDASVSESACKTAGGIYVPVQTYA